MRPLYIREKIAEGVRRYYRLNPDKKPIGDKNPMFGMRGEKHPRYGKVHSEKTKEKLRLIKLGKKCPDRSGEKHHWYGVHRYGVAAPNWQGGKSFEPYPIEFNRKLKLFIRQRDNFQCQFCGVDENKQYHSPHHIDYNKENNNFRNLITLCRSCNSKANSNRELWEFCFTVLMELRCQTPGS